MNLGFFNIQDFKYITSVDNYPKGMFIPKDHHYNANNKRKKGKRK